MSTKKKSDIRIVILQRGWVYVGKYTEGPKGCLLTGASCVRRWGTEKGLGELALSGPLANTILDRCPDVRFHPLTVIATLDCVGAVWLKHVS